MSDMKITCTEATECLLFIYCFFPLMNLFNYIGTLIKFLNHSLIRSQNLIYCTQNNALLCVLRRNTAGICKHVEKKIKFFILYCAIIRRRERIEISLDIIPHQC